jgi:O-antigen ligase
MFAQHKIQAACRTILLIVLYAMPVLLAKGRAYADIGLSTIAIGFLLYSIFYRKWDWLRALDVRVLLLLWGYLCLQSLFASDFPKESFVTALLWGRFIVFYAAVRHYLLIDETVRRRLAYFTLLTVIFLLIDTGYQYVYGTSLSGMPKAVERLTGPLSFPNIGTLILKLMLPVCVVLAAVAPRRVSLVVLGAVMIIVLSGERGTFMLTLLALTTSALGICMLSPALRKKTVLACMVITACASLLFTTQPYVQQRTVFMVEQLHDFSASEYGKIYSAAYHIWMEHPLFGVGIRQFQPACTKLVEQGIVPACLDCGTNLCNFHPHNTYLQFFSEAGLVGALLYLLFAGVCVRQWLQLRMYQAALDSTAFVIMGTAILVLFFPFINAQSFFSNWPACVFWFSLAAVMSCAPEHYKNRKI